MMLFITLWAYQTTYKVITKFTPFELVYGTQPIMPIELWSPPKESGIYQQKILIKPSM
jgi:hypothetical protein